MCSSMMRALYGSQASARRVGAFLFRCCVGGPIAVVGKTLLSRASAIRAGCGPNDSTTLFDHMTDGGLPSEGI